MSQIVPSQENRLEGISSTSLSDKRIFVAGVSGGSPSAEKLFRIGLSLTVCDPGLVKEETLSRTAFDRTHLGMPKVDAFAGILRNIDPDKETHAFHCAIEDVAEHVFVESDLIIAGTDNRDAQAYASDMAVKHGKPFVAIGVHELGCGGHIVYRDPTQKQGCYRCGPLASRFEEGVSDEDTNLAGAPGCIIDVQNIDMHAMRICIAMLERGQPTLMGRFYEAIKSKGYAVVTNHPEYEFGHNLMTALLADLPTEPKRYADELRPYLLTGSVVWLESDADSQCPICSAK